MPLLFFDAHLALLEPEPYHLDGEALQVLALFHEVRDSDVQPGLAPDRGVVLRRVASAARSALAAGFLGGAAPEDILGLEVGDDDREPRDMAEGATQLLTQCLFFTDAVPG